MSEKKKILMIGCGSIGSWTSLCLSRTNFFNLFLQDFDIFEEKNIKGQFVSIDLIGKGKAEALKILCERFNGYDNITPIAKKFNEKSNVAPITLAVTDNIVSRKTACMKWLALPSKELFIDARLSNTDLRIYVLTKNTQKEIIDEHLNNMYPDDKTIDDNIVCTISQSTYCGATIGGYITSKVLQYLSGIEPEYATEINLVF